MVKDDAKDQIPLFELPTSIIPVAPTEVAPDETSEPTGEIPAPAPKAAVKMPTPGPVARVTGKREPRATPKKKPDARTAPGPVPKGDVRLTANIREDLHLKLKIVAATRRTTIGELIEELVAQYL
jgi:hypothetical protein